MNAADHSVNRSYLFTDYSVRRINPCLKYNSHIVNLHEIIFINFFETAVMQECISTVKYSVNITIVLIQCRQTY